MTNEDNEDDDVHMIDGGNHSGDIADPAALQKLDENPDDAPDNAPNDSPNDAPNDTFDNYGNYLQAKAEHIQAYHAWSEERAEALAAEAGAMINDTPALKQVIAKNMDIIESIPPHIEQIFLQMEASDAISAALALLEEGKMTSLFDMPPALAAVQIGRAGATIPKQKRSGLGDQKRSGLGDQKRSGLGDQKRSGLGDQKRSGLGDQKQKTTSQAPAPMIPNRGAAATFKPLADRSIDDIDLWLNS